MTPHSDYPKILWFIGKSTISKIEDHKFDFSFGEWRGLPNLAHLIRPSSRQSTRVPIFVIKSRFGFITCVCGTYRYEILFVSHPSSWVVKQCVSNWSEIRVTCFVSCRQMNSLSLSSKGSSFRRNIQLQLLSIYISSYLPIYLPHRKASQPPCTLIRAPSGTHPTLAPETYIWSVLDTGAHTCVPQ